MKLIWDIIEREGPFVDHPNDRGGPTNWGITQDTLSMWRRRVVTRQEVVDLTPDEAYAIYEAWYDFPEIMDPLLREAACDAAVHHGKPTVTRWLQLIVGTTPDRVWGPNTRAAVNGAFAASVTIKLVARRIRYFGAIVSNDRSQAAFIKGWLNRGTSFLDHIAEEV